MVKKIAVLGPYETKWNQLRLQQCKQEKKSQLWWQPHSFPTTLCRQLLLWGLPTAPSLIMKIISFCVLCSNIFQFLLLLILTFKYWALLLFDTECLPSLIIGKSCGTDHTSRIPTAEIRQLDVLNGTVTKVSACQNCKLKVIKYIHPQGIMSQNCDFGKHMRSFPKIKLV